MTFPPSDAPAPRPRTPADIARWGWIALGLSVLAPAVVLLSVAGVQIGPVAFLGVPALIGGVILGILALRRGVKPRWPAITAIALAGLYALVFVVFLVWAIGGLIQIMFLPTY